jgi:hypothetical protein
LDCSNIDGKRLITFARSVAGQAIVQANAIGANIRNDMEHVTVKPIVNIKDAFIVNGRMFGKPLNHPGLGVSNMRQVVTSPILQVDGDRVETENTVYNVLSWSD